jgi:GTP-binding protein
MKFIDEIHIVVGSGKGGPGSVSFRREAMVPRGGPDGGDGGKGGNLVLKVDPNINSLVDFRAFKKYIAQNGGQGEARNCSGADGKDLVLPVPHGTVVRDTEGNILVDMTDIQEHILLHGGRGGKGNTFFKNSVNQAPEHAQPGEPGETLEVVLELKLIADVGIIGFPNAGKSTLISRISAARPKIADYPFTTLTPQLGVVKAADYRSFVVADIPGLVEGAHTGVGLGIQFLKHIERTKVFVHLIDVSGVSQRSPEEDFAAINNELKMYDQAHENKDGFFPLSTRPQLVVFNKMDVLSADDLQRKINSFSKKTGIQPLVISAVSGKNIDSLILKISDYVFHKQESESL